jgi:hypothetical protein
MMVLPFVCLAGAAAAILAGQRGLALGLWAIALVGTLALFAAHATDTLQLSF